MDLEHLLHYILLHETRMLEQLGVNVALLLYLGFKLFSMSAGLGFQRTKLQYVSF